MYNLSNDAYKTARGGYSRILDITCEHCGAHVCYYQKDGPGNLRRMYVDRMIDYTPTGTTLVCTSCKRELATHLIYAKENRPAYRLYVDAVNKKVTSLKQLRMSITRL